MKPQPPVRDPLEETQENPELPSIRPAARRGRPLLWVVLGVLVAALAWLIIV